MLPRAPPIISTFKNSSVTARGFHEARAQKYVAWGHQFLTSDLIVSTRNKERWQLCLTPLSTDHFQLKMRIPRD
jgi:hypothetical protein